jgi:two-component system chemotaxis sensor kinase CheA
MDELLEQFLIEGRELVEQASNDLVSLERSPNDAALLDTIFRAVHTLKGSVALFDFAPMGRALHAAEDLLGAVRSKKAKADRAMIEALLECIDVSDRWIESIASTGNLPTTAEQEARVITVALVASLAGEDLPAPAAAEPNLWVSDLLSKSGASISSGPVIAVRYVPNVDAFLSGDDPVLVARSIPQLLALQISGRDAWNSDGFDPYRCNLVIEALSGAPIDEIREVFASVADQVIIVGDALGDVPPEALSTAAAIDNTSRTVRVDTARIDALVDLVGELIVAKNNLGHLAAQAADAASPFASALAANYAGFERLTGDMHRTVMRTRMVPLARTFGRFPRWMRDTAAKLGKEVDFSVSDNGAEADKAVVDGLFEPLLHVLRNAVDHGLEDAASRQSAGKSATGHISLEARLQGDQIEIVVEDDGSGLNIARIREIAKSKGVMDAEAIDALDDVAAADLIFMPGFSTASVITDISGRGVGMDAVRTAVAALGGRVAISSALGAGTTVRLTLPQAVLVSTVVMVDVGGERFGVPIESVTETHRIPHDRIVPIRGGEAFVLRDRTLPLLSMVSLLQLPRVERTGTESKVLIVRSGSNNVGVEVDGVGERLDVLLRPMTGLLSGMRGLLGTALLGDGRVLLVLDLPELTA